MKLITLNVWGGRVSKPLALFIAAKKDIDIFCFQEVFSKAAHKDTSEATDDPGYDVDTLGTLSDLLPDHVAYFCPITGDYYGLAMFVKRGIRIVDSGEATVYDPHENLDSRSIGLDHARKLQWLKARCSNGEQISILNIHGHWAGKSKSDTADRLEQSKKILAVSKSLGGEQVLCGDFNLRPDTESIRMIERAGMKNLITRYNIASTRSSLYTREEKFADFIFVSSGVEVRDFRVLPDVVSDHSPLYLKFDM
ncbi:MAG: endonuclease/exonuclease/phosphatase family protein [Patescibacteria group bacterium]|nr:endonuclease/exonuclease/phosphatase family protein [Patescibacteria group bacterium]MDE2116263.1 endonuclease/exonuclease/phosphatase family protein [Patescibacteria group bacterium]